MSSAIPAAEAPSRAMPPPTDAIARIMAVIASYVNAPRPGDPAWDPRALNPVHARKVAASLAVGEPLVFALPAFPAKSPSQAKTIGPMPDYGEVLALEALQRLADEVSRWHPAGARVVICSDGRVFGDVVEVPDAAISAYRSGIARIIAARGLSRLSLFTLDEVFSGMGFARMREALVERHGDPLDAIKAAAREDEAEKALFNGIHRFLFEDRLNLHPHESRTQARHAAKERAYRVVQRSHAWSRVVAEAWPAAVRLSIHPHPPSSEKLGVRLLPADHAWATPWHRAPLVTGRGVKLVTRVTAEGLGATLRHAEGRYAYYALGPVKVTP